jgi:hypothetical protein
MSMGAMAGFRAPSGYGSAAKSPLDLQRRRPWSAPLKVDRKARLDCTLLNGFRARSGISILYRME